MISKSMQRLYNYNFVEQVVMEHLNQFESSLSLTILLQAKTDRNHRRRMTQEASETIALSRYKAH